MTLTYRGRAIIEEDWLEYIPFFLYVTSVALLYNCPLAGVTKIWIVLVIFWSRRCNSWSRVRVTLLSSHHRTFAYVYHDKDSEK